MATYTLSAADALLKDLYVGPIIELMNYKTYMLDQIERDSTHIDHTGRRAVIPVNFNKNRGRGSRGDNENLPVAGTPTDVDAIVKIRYHYYAMEITDPTIEASKNDKGAFANLLTRESEKIGRNMRKDINRQVHGSQTGALSKLAKTSKEKKVYLSSVQYIGVGDPIDILKASDGSSAAGGKGFFVTKRVVAAESYIETNENITGEPTTEYSVYISGSYKNEMDGLQNIVAKERTLHEINSATAGQENWDGKVESAESNIAGETLFEKIADRVGETGNGEIDVFVGTRGIKRRLADTFQSAKRSNDAKNVEVHGGYTAIWVNEKPLVIDDDCVKGTVYGINKNSFRWFEQAPPGWLEKDGGIFTLKNSSTAGMKMNVWQAWFKWYAALGCTEPNLNGKIELCEDDLPT